MNKLILIALAGLFYGCAGAPLPQDQREIKYVESVPLNKADVYRAAFSYLAKNLGDSNLAIKVKDQEAGTIITEIAIECSELKNSFMDPNKHIVFLNLEVNAKDNRARFVYEALEERVMHGFNGSPLGVNKFTSKGQVDSIKPCIEREKLAILNAMSAKKSDANW